MGQSTLAQDANKNKLDYFYPQGGKVIAAATPYATATDFGGATIIKLGADSTIAMSDTIAVPYSKGDVIVLREGETYTFGTAQNIGLM